MQKTEFVKTEEEQKIKLEDKYFWLSRAVYAVEFEFDVFDHITEKGVKFHEVKLMKVEFEENLIHVYRTSFMEKDGKCLDILSNGATTPNWAIDLWEDYLVERRDRRTKEQFYSDYKSVIKNLSQHIR